MTWFRRGRPNRFQLPDGTGDDSLPAGFQGSLFFPLPARPS
jgi:hypothetical protein